VLRIRHLRQYANRYKPLAKSQRFASPYNTGLAKGLVYRFVLSFLFKNLINKKPTLILTLLHKSPYCVIYHRQMRKEQMAQSDKLFHLYKNYRFLMQQNN